MSRRLATFLAFCVVGVLAAVLPIATTTVALAATTVNWTDGTASWSTPANWTNAFNNTIHLAPALGDTVNIAPADDTNRTITYDVSAPTLGALTIDLTSVGTNRTTFSMSANTLTTIGFLVGSSGRAAFTQSGGSNITNNASLDSVIGHNAGANGIYNLSSTGSLSIARDLYVGNFGTGAFNQSGGISSITSVLVLAGQSGSSGTYTLSGGNLSAARQYVGSMGTGVFNHSNGTNTINAGTGFLDVGVFASGNGTYNLSGTGALVANTHEYVGDVGTGLFSHTGGTNSILGAGHNLFIGGGPNNGTGTYTISGTGSTSTLSVANDVVVGNTSTGTGTLNVQNLGSVQITNNLTINSHGTVNLSTGGTLRFNGFSNAGSFNYSGGTVQLAGNRNLGAGPITTLYGATPTVTANKTLVIEGSAYLASTFNVNGGALSADNGFTIGDYATNGTLNLTGGANVSSVGGVTMAGITRSTADATISAPGSTWTTGGFLLADEGTATLNISSGGTLLNIGNSLMSLSFNAHSTATVTGANSLWNVTGSLTVGNLSTGTLNIQNQGLVYVGAQLSIGAEGVINLDGGTIRFNDYFRFDNGVGTTGKFNFNTGTIQLAGNRSIGTDAAIKDLFGVSPTIAAGKGLTVEGTAAIASALTLNGGTLRATNLIVNGAFQFGGGMLELTGGTVTGLTNLSVPTGGEFRASGVQSLRIAGAAGSTITATGNLTLGDAAAVNGFYTDGTLSAGANTVTLNDANDAAFDTGALVTLGSGTSPGTLDATNGLSLDFGGNVTGFGTVSTPNNLAKPLINNGHISGTSAAQRITLPGYVKGVGTFDNVNFTGTFSPGLSPTILSVGNIALSNTSALIMELGGTTPGSGYDQIQSSGALTFDGALQVSLINGFAPVAGQSFNLFDWASTSGTFDALQLPAVAGLAWNTSQLYTTGVLSLVAAGLPGDYNQNGVVDAADYTVWRDHLGSGTALPNDDTVGVGQDDYTRWVTHFGQSAGSGAGSPSSSSPVPEPAAAILIIVSAAILAFPRRRPRNRR